jgi:hypothetical protein
MPASQPSYPATKDTSHPIFTGSTNQILTFGNAGGWAVNNGSGVAAPTVNGTTTSGTTSLGNALVFDGTSTYLDYGTTGIPAVEWTLFLGGVFDANDSPRGLADCTVNGVSGWNIYQGGSGAMYCNNSSYPAGNPSSGWPVGTLTHLAIRNKEGTGLAWFRDGVQIATGTGMSPTGPTVPLWIGRLRVGGLPYLKATLSYLYLIDKYLDATTIASIASDPYAIFLAGGGGGPTPGYGFVKVSGSWKNLSGVYVKVSGVWKSGSFQPNVSGSWKTLVP